MDTLLRISLEREIIPPNCLLTTLCWGSSLQLDYTGGLHILFSANTELPEIPIPEHPSILAEVALKQIQSNCITCVVQGKFSVSLGKVGQEQHTQRHIFKVTAYALVQWSTRSVRIKWGQIVSSKQDVLRPQYQRRVPSSWAKSWRQPCLIS